MPRGSQNNLVKGLAFVSPWLIGFCIFTAMPVAMSFYYSLCDFSLLKEPLFIGARNYKLLAADEVFWKALKNTVIYALLAIPSAMAVSLGLAMLLNVKIRCQAIYRTLIFLPSLMPIVASSMLWLWLFNGKLGLINTLLAKIHINGPAWLTDVMFTIGRAPDQTTFYWAMPALVLMSLWGVGHTVTIYLAGLQDVPQELYEAAEIDGAGIWGRILNVTLPMLSPVIFFNLIMAIIGTLQVFAIPYIMTQGGPARATYFFTMYLYDNAFRFLRMGYASAMAWMLFVIILGLTALVVRAGKNRVHYTGA